MYKQHFRIYLRFILVVLLTFSSPLWAEPNELPPITMQVNDFADALKLSYSTDLNLRLTRLENKIGYAIVIVLTAKQFNESLENVALGLFESNDLETKGSKGTLVVLLSTRDRRAAVATSTNLKPKFSVPRAQRRIANMFKRYDKNPDAAVERVVHVVLEIIDPWFYVLDPPKDELLYWRSPTTEVILFSLAPFLGLMVGVALMALTLAGQLSSIVRAIISGFSGCIAAVAAAFVLRQRGGIVPGMVLYSGAIAFVIGVLVGALRPFWFEDKVRGRKPGDKFHPPFYGRG
jgi:hypothetical protein